MLAVGAIVDTDGKLSAEQPTLYVLYVIAGSLLTILFLEFVAISVEVTPSHVQFSISPFYRRRALISDIQDWEVKTYPAENWGRYYRIRGWLRDTPTHCVLLRMNDGSQMEFTCAHAEHLAHAISRAKNVMNHPLQASA